MELLGQLVNYLGQRLTRTPGEDIMYYGMPDMPDRCIAVQEPRASYDTPAQIDAEKHFIKFTARGRTVSEALRDAEDCYRAFYIEEGADESTGFITVNENLSIYVQLHSTPLWDKNDSKGRAYFYFTATIITKRLI